MFNSTHTFVGFAIAGIAPQKWVRYSTATALIAANLPDIDSIAGFWGTAAYLDHHRGITHALIGVPILALLLSAVMGFFSGNFARTFTIALIAAATHPALDYLNSYGLRPFLPWNGRWYYGDLLFIFDPYLDAALMLGLVLGRFWPRHRRFATVASLVLAVAYIGVRIELHARATAQIQPLTHDREVEKWAVLPKMWNPQIWDVILQSKTELVRFDVRTLRRPGIDSERIRLDNAPSSEIVNRAADTRAAAALLRFARFPVTRVEESSLGYRVTFLDFRFYNETSHRALASQITLDQYLYVIEQALSFAQRL